MNMSQTPTLSGDTRAFDGVFKDTDVLTLKWNKAYNSTERGSFIHLVDRRIGLKPGMIVKAMSPRREQLILIGTPIGNVVFFKRFRQGAEVIYGEFPREVRMLFGGIIRGEITDEILQEFLGYSGTDNIGVRLHKFLKYSNNKVMEQQGVVG